MGTGCQNKGKLLMTDTCGRRLGKIVIVWEVANMRAGFVQKIADFRRWGQGPDFLGRFQKIGVKL